MKPKSFYRSFSVYFQIFFIIFFIGTFVAGSKLIAWIAFKIINDIFFARIILAGITSIPAAAIYAYLYKGDTLSRSSQEKDKFLERLTIRLAENGYSLESQTDTLITFKPSWKVIFTSGVIDKIYVVTESDVVKIVGPSFFLKKNLKNLF